MKCRKRFGVSACPETPYFFSDINNCISTNFILMAYTILHRVKSALVHIDPIKLLQQVQAEHNTFS